jgi:hypothetical protein
VDGDNRQGNGFAVIDNVQGAIQWVQSLPNVPKGIITLVVTLAWALVLYILWQKPAEIPPENQVLGATNQSGIAVSRCLVPAFDGLDRV